MSEKEITCIVCPIGCKILIRTDENKCEILNNGKCKRGNEYARSEALNPQRMLTTSVLVEDGNWPLVSVKSSKPVPKKMVFQILQEIKKINLKAPIRLGDVLVKDILETKVNIIATKNVDTLNDSNQ